MNTITNPHFLYLHSSIATQSQVYEYVQSCIKMFEDLLNEKFNREIIVNTVTKYDGTPLKHSYVWCRSIEVVNLLLNRTKDGVDRVEEIPDPEHDTVECERKLMEFFMKPTPINCSWVDLVDEEEQLISKTIKRKIKRPMKPLVEFGTIVPTEEQRLKYPNVDEIQIKFFHLSVPFRAGYMNHKLFANHISKEITEQHIRKYFEPYVSEKKDPRDKKTYPIIHIDRKSNPTSVSVCYQPLSYDGTFALLMNKRIVFSEKSILNFELYRES